MGCFKLQIILLVFLHEALMIDSNDESLKTNRKERVNGHILKISPDKPNPILCHKEGFLGDQNDCSVFYQCMKTNDKYTVFRFQCAPGTVFDTIKEICNYPQLTQRSDCHILNQEQKYDNDIIDFHNELPKPITNTGHDMGLHKPLGDYNYVSEDYQEPSANYQETNPVKSTTAPQTTATFTRTPPYLMSNTEHFQDENHCTKEGFIGDTLNCKKFYRCVNNLRGGFIRYEFLCNEATIWDDSTQGCNHVRIARNLRCGQNVNNNINMGYGYKNYYNSNAYPTKQNNENLLEVNLLQPSTIHAQNSTEKYNDIKIDIDSNTFVEKPIFSKVQMQYGDKILGNDNTESYVTPTGNKIKGQIHNNIDEISHSTEFNPPFDSNSQRKLCVQNGFYGYPGDCKKFYRCIESSSGTYVRYDFSCSDGTVWDDNLKACNFAWAVKECGSFAPLKDLTSMTSDYSNPSSLYTTSSPIISLSADNVGYTSHIQTNDESSSKVSTLIDYGFSPSYDAYKNECDTNGFHSDPNNCQNFYRCIETRKGVFTKLSYKCGEGTLWDPSIEACNHAWAVKNCTISMSSSTTTSNTPVIMTISLIQTTTQANEMVELDYDVGYNQGSNNLLLSTPKDIVNSGDPNKCSNSGFMGDSKDCKKFYRCVDKGNGKFTQFEFSCGEGTVWDPKIESCNHAWAVEKCGGILIPTLHYDNETALPSKPTTHSDNIFNMSEESSDKSQTTALENSSSKPISSSSNAVYASSTAHSSSYERPETNSSSLGLGELCESEGFYRDLRDCKKFYRCIDNGSGKYVKYEFSCGEGTAWDLSINSCNHINNVKSCQGMSNEIDGENNLIETTSHTDIETTKRSTSITLVTTNIMSTSPMKCKEEGYFGNSTDCKKFYRCVADGKARFEMYEYLCGEGTIWDQDIIACNHPQNVERPFCSTEYNLNATITDSIVSQTAPISNDQSTSKPTTSSANPTNTISTISPSTSSVIINYKDCVEEGYFGDSNDCKIFYRCVNEGKDQYTKYEFYCGEGTIWDQDILGCNHPTYVKKITCSENNGLYSTTTNKNVATSESLISKVTTHSTHLLTTTTIHSNTVKNTEMNDKQSSTTLKPNYQTTSSSSINNMKPVNQNTCIEEGYIGDNEDCKKFYRCVDNGKNDFAKYDFTCGEGTIWDQYILACNHPRDVKQSKCLENNNYSSTTVKYVSTSSKNPSSKVTSNTTPLSPITINDSNTVRSTEWYDKGTSTTFKPIDQTTISTTSNLKPIKQNTCLEEGYFGDTEDCNKFYRCVDNGKNEFTMYDFTCGEGTIWDQDITTCNHPQDVQHPSCASTQSTTTEKQSHQTSSSTQISTESISSTSTQYTSPTSTSASKSTSHSSSSSSTTKEGTSTESNENLNSTDQQQKGNFTCTEAGFYPNPNDCKKFYRCVDWNNDGSYFSIFHFECGEGTIWDPSLDTCNYENAIYPQRNCSVAQTQNSTETNESSPTDITTTQATTSSKPSNTKSTTEQSSTTPTTQSSTTSNSEQSTTTSTTEKSSTSSTTEQSSTISTTEESSTTSTIEQSSTTSTTEGSSTTSTTEQSSTSSTTEQSSTISTTEQSNPTTETTTKQTEASSTDQTTTTTSPESTTTERASTPMDQTNPTDKTTEESSTSEATTQPSSAESTEGDRTTTEGTQQTTEGTTSSTSKDKCPEMEEDQYAYVCPTSFRRHPKYCNVFYQCTEDDDNHDLKIALFHCPNNTIYDETKTQCVDANKSSKKCDGSVAQTYRFKRFSNDYIEPISVGTESYACPSVGYFPLDKNQDCSQAILKCQRSKNNKLAGYVFKCPEEYTFWSISKRCEKTIRIRECKRSTYPWEKRYEIPKETHNVAY